MLVVNLIKGHNRAPDQPGKGGAQVAAAVRVVSSHLRCSVVKGHWTSATRTDVIWSDCVMVG
ncbi:MAG: hypothetical protein ACKO1W_10385, partial [Microcystaceae cyanobacterium]